MNGRDSSISRNTPFLIFSLLGERASGEAASKLGHFPGTFAVSRSGCAYQEIPGWKGKAKGNLEVTTLWWSAVCKRMEAENGSVVKTGIEGRSG